VLLVNCKLRTGGNRSPNSIGDHANNRVTIGTTSKLRTIDPADAYESLSGQLLRNLGDTLYTYESGTTKLIPHLATAMPKVSQDGLTYTIPLRQGVIFHDDTPFNAAAMEFSLQRFIKNGGSPAFLLSDAVESVKATGEYELTFQLKKPFAAFPSLLTFGGICAVSPKAYEIGEGKFKPIRLWELDATSWRSTAAILSSLTCLTSIGGKNRLIKELTFCCFLVRQICSILFGLVRSMWLICLWMQTKFAAWTREQKKGNGRKSRGKAVRLVT
jgi:ABC-type dipeptide transport system, periplasmic component